MRFTEKLIAKRCIADLLKAGYSISVNDGEETTLRRSTDRKAIFAAMATTDEDWLQVHDGSSAGWLGWVRFIYGNDDGTTVISDYSVNLEPVLAGVNALAEKMGGA